MITLDEAKKLTYGDILIEGATERRWKVNGKVKTWKTRPEEIKVPLKHGLYSFGYLTHNNRFYFTKETA